MQIPDQNQGTDDELPTYDALAAQNGPNSRFGRWKGWVEKRAAERYAEDTPETRQARRMRGWGPHVDTRAPETLPPTPSQPLLSPPNTGLSRTQTVLSNSNPTPSDGDQKLQPPTSHITMGQALPPSHLKLHTFGSRFLPHSELPILSLLPLFNDQKLLIGHMDGLTLLDMAPEVTSSELDSKEPRRRDIWHGEGVYQMTLLEHEQPSATGTPQGVILALVGAEPPEGGSDKDSKEPMKAIRMYNLASLASITSWAAARKDTKALDLSHPVNWQPQQPIQQKKHRHHLSMSRGLKSKNDHPDPNSRNAQTSYPLLSLPPPPPPKDVSTPPSPPKNTRSSPHRGDTGESEWDMVGHDDLPLRWATDYVPLASPTSRLANQSVLFFELHRSTDQGRVTARLAVATRQNILLYETMRGERAFRFVKPAMKEFYTPIPARSVTFVSQCSHDSHMKTYSHVPSSLSPQSATSSRTHSHSMSDSSSRRASSPVPLTAWSSASSSTGQLSLFVVFEKKAGLIRISDSAVGEIELWEEPSQSRRTSGHSPVSGGSFRRSIGSLEGLSLAKDWKGPWSPPAEITLPLTSVMPQAYSFVADTVPVCLLTRGKHTHIVSSPLPMPLAAHAPLKVLKWGIHPTRVVPRVCEHPSTTEPFLQVTALSEDGVEVQEFPLNFLSRSKGKGKMRDYTIAVQAEVGPGGAGFLCMGGHWTERNGRRTSQSTMLQRQSSASTVDTVDLATKRTREEGFYAWTQKGYDDWRVFWLGGDANDEEIPPPSP